MITVRASREGLVGAVTASGWDIDKIVPFVALPSTKALGRFLRLINPTNKKSCIAIVLDVGPWNENDDAYVFRGERPAAERGEHIVRVKGQPPVQRIEPEKVNGAGIDLGEKVWKQLGMKGNTNVSWEFIS